MDHFNPINSIAARPLFDLLAWGFVFLLVLAGIGAALFMERRGFARRGKGGGWLKLRLLALPLLGITAAAVVLPARSISGMEALAVFYGALFTVGPLVWFGGHVLLGRLIRPVFTTKESAGVAFSGLGLLLAPALVASLAQEPIALASHRFTERGFARAPAAAMAHTAMAPQRFDLPGAGEVLSLSLIAPSDISLERIDADHGGGWYNTKNSMHPTFCRNGDDLHLFWSAREPAPRLRLFWRDAQGQRRQAEFTPDPAALAAAPAQAFNVRWRQDGFDLPVPVPRQRVSLGWHRDGGTMRIDGLDFLQPGENFQNDCLIEGYRRLAWQREGPVGAILVTFHPPPPATPLQARIQR